MDRTKPDGAVIESLAWRDADAIRRLVCKTFIRRFDPDPRLQHRTIQTWLELAGVTTGPLFRPINRHGQLQHGRLSGIDGA